MAEQQRDRKASAFSASKSARALVACLATVLVAFCGWSAAQYLNGNDPLAFLTGASALQTTVEAAQDEESAPQQAEAAPRELEASGTAAATEALEETPAAAPEAQEEQAVAETQQSSSTSEAAPQTTVYETSSPAGQGASSQSQALAPARTIVVTLSIDGGEGVSSAQIELNPGSTAYDALLAAGVSVSTIPNHFGSGTWVTSIGGLAEDAVHGWTYRVNGSMPNVMSDLYELHDGDSVLWQYV